MSDVSQSSFPPNSSLLLKPIKLFDILCSFQLDKIGLGGGSAKGKKTPLSRPHSESDFGDLAEMNEPPLTDKEVLEQFDKMLDDMNLTDEKRAPLKSTSLDNKRKLLATYNRGSSAYNTVTELNP